MKIESGGPETWVDAHGNALYRYALARVGDPSVAEEMVQETLLAALRSYDKFAARSSERTWLVGILKHKLGDHYRRLSCQSQFHEDDDRFFEHDELFQHSGEWAGHWNADRGPVEWRMTPETSVERAEFWEVVSACLAELPPRTASAFVLREMEGMSTEEICKELNVSASNLWVMLHRARMHLRHCMETRWFARPD